MTNDIKIARAALHYWEEPCISGKEGSGTIFFSGCNLRCVYCQNHSIALGNEGKEISMDRLVDIFFEFKEKGANNINLVTPSHYINQIVCAIEKAKNRGFDLPFVYNTSSYEKVERLKRLEGLIDVYLPDLKYMDESLALKYSFAKDYPTVATKAIEEMYRQRGEVVFDRNGMITNGVIIRHMILPGYKKNSKAVIEYVLDTYNDKVLLSVMNQYTPVLENAALPEELKRKVTKREYENILSFALEKGMTNGFFQDGDVSKESFIPAFDGTGV